jgi:hypothetical protein
MFGGGDWLSTLLWFVFLWLFIWLGPRIMLTQALWNLEKEVLEMEQLAKKAEDAVARAFSKHSSRRVKEDVARFMDFFSIFPVDLDPYGIVKKIDHIVRNSEKRFREFVRYLSPDVSEVRERDLKAALTGAITSKQIAKLVRHYFEMVKKYKNFQIALLLQMQIPLIKNLLKASVNATKAFINEIPIGDSIGPLVAARLMEKGHKVYKEEEFVVAKTTIGKKRVWVAKALGPGATTGKPGKFLKKFLERNKIDRIITVDAALKLEGERSGSIAEGIGVAMGGIGVERYEIEEIASEKGIRLDALVIKQSNEEALQPMKKEIFESVEEVVKRIEFLVSQSANKSEKILIIGVGNTCGVGNNPKALEEVREKLRKIWRMQELQERKSKKTSLF